MSNAARAAQQYAQYYGTMRDEVTMPEGAVLHPQAPVDIQELIPSARVNIAVEDLLTTMEVVQVTVSRSNGGDTRAQTAVKLASVNDDLPELVLLDTGGPQ